MDQLSDILVLDQLTPVGRCQPLLYFPKKPLIVVHEPRYSFLHQRLCVATSLGGEAAEFGL
jgi:hypothetical protein